MVRKIVSLVFVVACTALLAACGGPDGQLGSCACAIGYADNGNIYPEGDATISVCVSDFTQAEATATKQCEQQADATDTAATTHICSCKCAHMSGGCYLQ